jgi:predicted metal-dependent hydrolase
LAPTGTTDETILGLLAAKEYLLHSKLAKWAELNAGQTQRPFVSGQAFLYLGRNYRLRFADEQDTDLLFRNNYFTLRREALPNARKFFIEFYKNRVADKIKERLALYQPKVNASVSGIRVMELKHRWASCTTAGRLNFHWKIAMAPVSVLDYIIVHELVHLVHHNHSAAFWDELDKVLPTYRDAERWLRHNGVKMNL